MTTNRKATVANVLCFVAIALFIGLLVLLPPLLVKRDFEYLPKRTSGTPSIRTQFPVNSRMRVVWAPKNIALKTGMEVTLESLVTSNKQGVLVNFWATWCPPCIEEMPSLDYLNRELNRAEKDKYPQLVTISVDEKEEEIGALFRTLDFEPSFLVLHDPQGSLSRSVGTTKFPETYWVMPNGEVRYQWVGPQNWLGQGVINLLASRLE